jgi:hypothetical protein
MVYNRCESDKRLVNGVYSTNKNQKRTKKCMLNNGKRLYLSLIHAKWKMLFTNQGHYFITIRLLGIVKHWPPRLAVKQLIYKCFNQCYAPLI